MVITMFLNNRSPSLIDTIRQAGVAFDLTDSTVKLQARTEAVATLVIDAAATIVTASTTLAADTVLPEPSITATSTTGFLASGALNVGTQVVEYEEISGNTFLGCRGGDGTVTAASAVSQRGGVRYDWAAADVDAVVEFIAWWEVTLPTAKVQETPTFQVFVKDPQALTLGLCELSDVVSYAPGYGRSADHDTDSLLERMILSETRAIQRETGREFVAIDPELDTRRFDIQPWHLRSRTIPVGTLADAPTAVKIIDSDQATELATVAAADYVELPRVRQSSDPITHLMFPAGTTLMAGYVLEVEGSWGYPSIPADIREACAKLVVFRYATDAAQAGTRFSDSLADVNIGALFASARSAVESYILPRVA